ncbi:MAG: hypothetical protein E6P95_00985 [Candidatus Moraniibacteriota bacterium]|nr:MAG: hypothetical protein E6P95_00985 [Candidatus Moranbacteria bacterium]
MWPDDVVPHEHHRVLGYFKWVAIALVVLAGPTAVSAILNRLGWEGAISTVITLMGIGYLVILPLLVGGTGFIDLLRRLKKPAEEASEEEKARWRATNWTFNVWCVIFFGSLMGPVALALLPLQGFGGAATILVALIVPTIAWTLRYSESTWVIEHFAWFLMVAFCATLAYWIAAATMPGVVQSGKNLVNNWVVGPVAYWFTKTSTISTPDQLVREIEGEVIRVNTTKVTNCLARLKTKAASGAAVDPADIERCKALDTATDKWRAAKPPQDVRPASPAMSTAAGEINRGGEAEKAKPTPAAAPAAPAPRTVMSQAFSWQSFTPSRHQKFLSLGTVPAGTYRILCEGQRMQRFLENGVYNDYAQDCQGVLIHNGMKPWVHPGTKPNEMPIPLPREAYGALIRVAGNYEQPELALTGSFTVHTETEVVVGINISQSDNLFGGGGTLRVRVVQQ